MGHSWLGPERHTGICQMLVSEDPATLNPEVWKDVSTFHVLLKFVVIASWKQSLFLVCGFHLHTGTFSLVLCWWASWSVSQEMWFCSFAIGVHPLLCLGSLTMCLLRGIPWPGTCAGTKDRKDTGGTEVAVSSSCLSFTLLELRSSENLDSWVPWPCLLSNPRFCFWQSPDPFWGQVAISWSGRRPTSLFHITSRT